MSLPNLVDSVSERVAKATSSFVRTRIGKFFLSLVLVGPLTFLPTVYAAWTAPNIDSLRTLTWPLMVIVNVSATLSVVHNGDWRIRLAMVVWVVTMAAVFIATIVR